MSITIRLRTGRLGFDSRQRQKKFSPFATAPKTVSGPHTASYTLGARSSFFRCKRPGSGIDYALRL